MIYCSPSSFQRRHSSFLITAWDDFCECHGGGHLALQVLSRVTSCVTIHHTVTLYPRMRMLECVDVGIVMIGPHKVPRDLLSRSRVSDLLSSPRY